MPDRPEKKFKRALNGVRARRRLSEAGIQFEERNFGAQLLVAGAWHLSPGTGSFSECHGERKGRGVLKLIAMIKKESL